MQRIFNKDGFNWWIGCVEDRMDPEKMGRCKVRIFGYHTDNKQLLPTKDLPWCVPIQPITSAAISGVGSSPLGPVEGTWVIGFFLDGEDMQQPAMFGTIATRSLGGFAGVEEPDTLTNPNDGIVRDQGGRPVLDDQGNPVRSGTPAVDGWEIGQTSESFESGGRGPGTINAYANSGDTGGASYGTYQFASYLPQRNPVTGASRPSSKNSPVIQFINGSKFKEMFAGLEPATSAFDNKWREVASKYPKDFESEQHEYVRKNYYNVMLANLQRQGLNLSNYGPGVQDLIWSTAVQFGPARTAIFTEPLKGKSTLTDTDIINLVSEYKKNNVNVFFKSSGASIQTSQRNRYASEQAALLRLVTA